MKQLQAGYVIDGIEEYLSKKFDKKRVDGLLTQLSYFDVSIATCTTSKIKNPKQILFVVNNLISRGLPTRLSWELEQKIFNTFKIGTLNEKLNEIGSIKYDLNISEDFGKKLFRAIHIIEPRISLAQIDRLKMQPRENFLGSDFEKDFLYNKLPKIAHPFWIQLFESQRELDNILKFSTSTKDEIDKLDSSTSCTFNKQMTDFSIEYPYQIDEQRGFIVEIDGSQHEEEIQKKVDTNRDNVTEKVKWGRAVRIKTQEWDNISGKLVFLKKLENKEYFKLLKLNYTEPLCRDIDGQVALQLLLVPFVVARIQKVLVDLLLSDQLDLSKKEWSIAVVERDVSGSKLAIYNFMKLLTTLFKLRGEDIDLPKINLFVESSDEFKDTELSWIKSIDRSRQYDLFIDLSVLQRSRLQSIEQSINANIKVNIRSAHSPKTSRKFLTSELIKYKTLGKKSKRNEFIENEEQVKCLEKFVQDIFRKTSFRPGQVEIINRAIQAKSVIGLLPTGSGKSLTYQLSVLLQPGLAIVVDPIKSLMKDQYEGLLKNRIDCAIYINSSITAKHRDLAISQINNATTLFAFISPERLQDSIFRQKLDEASSLKRNYFSYCIIDEAHCVSEWGQDFRTSYLRLGDNARNYCKTKTGEDIPLFALTATASYDVLADIQRELKIQDDNAIVRLEKLDRPELQFVIKEVVTDIKSEQKLWFSNKKALGKAKQAKLVSEIKRVPQTIQDFMASKKVVNEASRSGLSIVLDDFSTYNFFNKEGDDNNAGLVFCPHKKWYFGVTDNASNIMHKIKKIKVDTFMGSDGEKGRDERNETSQSRFIENKTDLLVATKAFGMGIDKPNIRYIIHFNYPSSIESYYQEVGRAGRDRKIAIGIILFNQQEVEVEHMVQKVAENGEITEKHESYQTSIDRELLQSFHRNNFKGIEKEKSILEELLKKIKFQKIPNIKDIEGKIAEEFKLSVQLKADKNKNDRFVLYLNPNYGSIYLDREHLPFYAGDDATPQIKEIANLIKDFIKSKKSDNQTVFNWLSQSIQSSKEDGIEKLLENPDKPDEFIVLIPFANNTIEEISNYLQGENIDIKEEIVKKSNEFCPDIDTFVKNLEDNYKKSNKYKIVKIPLELKAQLKKYFLKIREEQDTFKAIYRLSIIGVIDDYTIDYRSDTVSVHVSKKRKGYYKKQLKKYLLQYSSKERVKEQLHRLEFYKGKSEIQKCLGFLIKFIYEEIAEQRKEAIKAMEEACKIGLQEDGSQRFKGFIDLYMNSKYARPEYLPSDTEKGLKEDFEIVKKYMRLVKEDRGGEINNLKHLRGAATVLLVQRPDNFVFTLLKAFAVFIIEKENEDFVKEAQLDFYNGFLKLSKTRDENILSVEKKVDYFKEKLSDFDVELDVNITEIENVLYHKLHTNWIEKFNTKFIGDVAL